MWCPWMLCDGHCSGVSFLLAFVARHSTVKEELMDRARLLEYNPMLAPHRRRWGAWLGRGGSLAREKVMIMSW